MASLPPSQRQSGSQRSSPSSTSPLSSPASSQAAEPSDTATTEAILLNPESVSSEKQESTESEAGPITRPVGARQDSADVKRCWICFSDETEDTPLSSSWRSPCPCALTAHESCLLDWVADIEGSNNGRSKTILCPQCKAEILIARPRSIVVDVVKAVEGAASRMVLPAIVFLGLGTALYLSASYGAITVHMVLGEADFYSLVESEMDNPVQVARRLVGLSLVPQMLILSRTSIADSVLPIVPMAFFVTQPRPDPLGDFSTWPPSAGLSFALLPYARAAYNSYFEFVWGDKVRRWMEQVKPRSTATQNNNDNNELELEIGLEEEDDEGAGEDVEAQQEDEADRELEAAIPPPIALAPNQAPPQNQNANQPVVREHHHHRRDYSISVSKVAQSVLGALVFPGISAIVGDLLRVTLPASWTSLSGRSQRPTRFLQTRWGRCIVGGCLFVVLKDAVTLYVRWKMAQNHSRRQVLDYEKSKARKSPTNRS